MSIFIENKTFEKIKELIEKSSLSEGDKVNFINLLSKVTDEAELENLAILFIESETWVNVLYDNYKNKSEALEQKDENKMNEILAGEESLIQTL